MSLGVWVKQGVIIPPTTSDLNGGVFFSGTSNGVVLYEGNAQILSGTVFKMWFMGGDNLYYAESVDGLSWTRLATALFTNAGLPGIFKNGSAYYLYISSNPTSPPQAIAVYTSSDGINWTLQTATGLVVGGGGAFDSDNVQYLTPFTQVLGVWQATYSTQKSGHLPAVGIATSNDLIHWTNGSTALISDCGSPNPHKVGSTYYVWGGYIQPNVASGTDPAGTDGCRSQSTDLATWTSPLVTLPRSRTNEGAGTVGGALAPQCLVEANGLTYNFYTGTPHEDTGTGYQIMCAIAPMALNALVATQEGEAVSGIPKQLATDNFTRANENPLSDGGNWSSAVFTALQVVSNQCEPATNGSEGLAEWVGNAWPNNQYSSVTVQAIESGGEIRVVGRAQDNTVGGGYYFAQILGIGSTNAKLFRVIDGTFTQLGSTFPLTVTAGDTFTLQCQGGTISLWRNGSMLFFVSDGVIINGNTGLAMASVSAVGNTRASLWAGGIFASGYSYAFES